MPLRDSSRAAGDDDPAFAVFERVRGRHVGGGQAHQVEGADEVDPDHGLEVGKRHRPVAADDATGRRDARAVDEDTAGAVRLSGGGDGLLGGAAIAHIAGDRQPADIFGECACRGLVQIEQGDLRPGARQLAGGRGAKPGAPARYDGGHTFDVHRSSLTVYEQVEWARSIAKPCSLGEGNR
jgi:hypothetical protein